MLGQKVPTLDFLTMVFVEMIPEVAADLPGGVQYCGPAFWKAVLQLFVALNSRRAGILDTEEGMRTDSSFEVEALEDGTKVVKVETHTPDFPRGEFFAVAYEAIGFPQAADECRARARQANGFQYPEFIVWKNKELGEIKVRTSDLVQFFPIVVEALMFAKMESLGGMSHADYVNWTPAREEKVQALVRFFMQV